MNYPTATFIRNLLLASLIGQYQDQLEYTRISEVVYKESQSSRRGTEEGNTLIKEIVEKFSIDIDDCVYDWISTFDAQFENDSDWFSEEDTDEKDRLRDEMLELIGYQELL